MIFPTLHLPGTRPLLGLGGLLALGLVEFAWRGWSAWKRRLPDMGTNLALSLLDVLVIRFTVPALVIQTAAYAQTQHLGLFTRLGVSGWSAALAGFLLMDLAVWGQHWATHRVPWLWRLHAVHHSDQFIDLTTGLRFHPLEILLSYGWKALVVLALGITPGVALTSEIALNLASLFEHTAINLPLGFDHALRWLLVTPPMHLIHHSTKALETNSNYGFCIPWWDRIFRTYRPEASPGLVIGLEPWPSRLSFASLLALPFISWKTNLAPPASNQSIHP